ncbi:HIT domain-containing protein [Yoonia sediminilitoris]|uniref:Diadenosine tetraphosphate (Ap4A) HIT family hydrolase n=1 Tax=Yoonia sediminilitoris TaxID=1286148 RepID=A0A2T6K7Y9_9RHOB|nr:HIT domain-containing protein [Yoonia sediminilitoris]PUB10859.1 diadenosine tetraphosphate (Ap4A) HIT family hydrolase [Yoonia sediminilitoris]RCW90534.1 diadenosine tetraphosphate (Ap4A) HIT family hydrolase [Yoonia sediminilitoris]
MDYIYDDQNIFAKILRGEIPNTTVYENEHALAFKDINPAAPVHVLVIPKGAYVSLDHFARDASPAEQVGFLQAVAEVCRLSDVEEGFRAISNTRTHGVQDVPHYHMHIIGGKQLGRMMPH